MISTLSLVAASLAANFTLIQAQPPASETPDIVVEGTKVRDEQVRQFVDALTVAPMGGQLSRFDWEVCPGAVGLPEAQNRKVSDRMRRVAEAVGIRVASGKCRPNALVIVADSKDDLIDGLWNKYPEYFSDASGDRIKPVKQPGPATAWHVEGLLDPDGVVPSRERTQKFYISSSTDSSRLAPATRPHFLAGILVVERRALADLTTTQLADYAAMRIFARTDPAKLAKSAPTILTVLDAPMDSFVPVTMTSWDFEFLRALYSSGGRQYANRQRNEIQERMRKELAQPGSGDAKR